MHPPGAPGERTRIPRNEGRIIGYYDRRHRKEEHMRTFRRDIHDFAILNHDDDLLILLGWHVASRVLPAGEEHREGAGLTAEGAISEDRVQDAAPAPHREHAILVP